VAREAEQVSHLEYAPRQGSRGKDEHVDILALELENGTTVCGPAPVSSPGKRRHEAASARIVVGNENPQPALNGVVIHLSFQVAVYHTHVLKLEVVGKIPLDSHPQLIVVKSIQPPVPARLAVIGHHFPHAHAGTLRRTVAVGHLVDLFRCYLRWTS